jgi:hypothetical protein
MRSRSDLCPLLWGMLGLGWLTVSACASPSAASRPPASADPPATVGIHSSSVGPSIVVTADVSNAGFELPARRSRATTSITEPPALSEALRAPLELTVELTTTITTQGRRTQLWQDVARGVDRVHVRAVDNGVEWLFLRNPVDPRRVSGRLVDHRRRAIVDYDESELRMSGIARGWVDVVALGVGPDALQGLTRSGRVERRFGFEFSEWRSAEGAPARNVLWSDEALLPWRISLEGDSSLVEVTSLRRGLERQRLIEPRERLPAYSVIDVADYREVHHTPVIPTEATGDTSSANP